MSTTILTTKLHVPPARQDWIYRPRLLARLDEGLRRKLTLVSAPAGFGKTTLVASWLHGLGERLPPPPRVGWLSLDEDDDKPLRFAAYLIAAGRKLDAGVGQTAMSLLEAPQPPAFEHLTTLLLNDLAELGGPAVLVLDDFHLLSSREVLATATFFLEHLPPQLHLILSARDEPNLPLARWRGQGQVAELRLEDLRFTREETAAFLARTIDVPVSDELVAALESRTEGWIAALQMAALAMRGGQRRGGAESATADVRDLAGAARDVIDYFGAEVLRQQPPAVRIFLRQTSILDRLSAPLCDAVTGQHESRAMLGQLAQANLFLIPLDDYRRWYRYHPLFADFLRSELSATEQRALHRRASEWYETHGFPPEAIKHALAAQDLDAAERLIRSCKEETFSRGGFSTLLAWLDALPDEVVRARSDLAADKAWILSLRGEVAAAEEYAAAAMQTERADDPPVERGMLLGFRAHLAIQRGDPAQGLELGRAALALLGNTKSFFRTTALSHLGQAQRLVGDRQAAIETLRQAVTVGHLLGHHLITLEALGVLTLLLYEQGQLREAIVLCQQAAGQYVDERGKPLPMTGLVLIPLGTLYFESNQLDRAESQLREGIALSQQLGTVYYTLLGLRTVARLQHVRGEIEAGWQTLAVARQLAVQSQSPRRVRMVDAVLAELRLRQGQLAAAAPVLAGLPPTAAERSHAENLAVARLLWMQGRLPEAKRLLAEVEASARRQGRLGTLVAVHVLRALSEKGKQRSAEALDHAAEALSLGAQTGNVRPLYDDAAELAALLAERRQAAPELADAVLAAAALAAPSAAAVPDATMGLAANQALAEPLSGTQLSVLRLVAEGLSNQEVANRLGITLGTTKWHLNQIYGKLGVASRTQAVAHARGVRLLS